MDRSRLTPLTCVESDAISTGDAQSWRAYRTDLPLKAEAEHPDANEVPTVATVCPACAAHECGVADAS